MLIEVKKIADSETTSPFYCIEVDGVMIANGWSGDYNEVLELYNKILADPIYLESRQIVLHSATI